MSARGGKSQVQDRMEEAVQEVGPVRVYASGIEQQELRDQVAVEEPLTIEIREIGSYTLMHAPTDPLALALGFAFSEGLILGLSDVNQLYCCPEDPGVIRMEIKRPAATGPIRNLPVVSACGLCGRSGSREALLSGLPRVGNSLRISPSTIHAAMEEMRCRQRLFSQTGATHGAAIFDAKGEIVALGEDIARHNALDKAIGRCLLEELPPVGCAVALSGRVTFELVAKSARAGMELISAVSAPSSLAIETAKALGVTLCAFVRGDRAAVYCHPERIRELPGASRG